MPVGELMPLCLRGVSTGFHCLTPGGRGSSYWCLDNISPLQVVVWGISKPDCTLHGRKCLLMCLIEKWSSWGNFLSIKLSFFAIDWRLMVFCCIFIFLAVQCCHSVLLHITTMNLICLCRAFWTPINFVKFILFLIWHEISWWLFGSSKLCGFSLNRLYWASYGNSPWERTYLGWANLMETPHIHVICAQYQHNFATASSYLVCCGRLLA